MDRGQTGSASTQQGGYPRPQFRRAEWTSLDGTWDFALDRDAEWLLPGEVSWGSRIVVPFAPETARGGVRDTGFYSACWYRRTIPVPPLAPRERLMLHFGAVDHAATVWANGERCAHHEGGYTPFSADVTDVARRGKEVEVVVRAFDDPADLEKPRGKQDWHLEPHSIWYPRTTGIWQTVWMERVPETHVRSLRWMPSLARWELGFEAEVGGSAGEGARLEVRLEARGHLLARDTYQVVAGEVARKIALSDPGIDDFRNELLWSPPSPTLIHALVELRDRSGALLVWEEMPSAYRFTRRSVERVTREWSEAIRRDSSHPCIVAWVPVNESWGVPNLPDIAAERHYVEALYHLTKTLDPYRPVIGNDGWESVATDIIGIHDYEADAQRLAARYHSDEVRPKLFRRERPGGRAIVLHGHDRHADHPIVLSEFGGIAIGRDRETTWGYSRADDGEALARRYVELLEVVRSLSMFAGFCYTQFADTYQEANGLLHADRTPKFPLEQIATATRGARRFSDLSMPPAPPPAQLRIPGSASDPGRSARDRRGEGR